MKKAFLLLIVLVLCGVMFIAGCVSPTTPPQTATPTPSPTATAVAYNVKVYIGTMYGNILTDGNGLTLYYSTRDVPGNGTSWCYDACAANWPPFSESPLSVEPPLNAADFGQINRTDGTKQVTYRGYPLYYFHTDTKPGETNGYGLLGSWFVISPSGIVTMTSTPTPTVQPTTVQTTSYSSNY